MSKKTYTRGFSYGSPVDYQGYRYPSTMMDIEDENGNVASRQVFADANGQYYSLDANGNAVPVILQNNLDEVVVKPNWDRAAANPELGNLLTKQFNDYITASNDNTQVLDVPYREYNANLRDNALKGAEDNALWEREHPNATAWRNAVETLPFAIAAAPAASAVVAGGDALAATLAGKAIGSGLGMAATTASESTWLPWLNALASSYNAANGLQDVKDGKFTPETAMDLMPLAQLGKPMYSAATKSFEPAMNWANDGASYMANSFFGDLISPKVGWYGRTAFDIMTQPIETYKTAKAGNYISDFASLRRNYNMALKDITDGIQSTNAEYKTLTGLDVPMADVSIQSWKHFSPGTTGYFSPREYRIHIPLKKNRFSNLRASSSALRSIGGHEQAHAANRWLTRTFNTPPISTWKNRNFLSSYFVSNPNHPIAQKYKRQFGLYPAFTGNTHGMSPEETWANYMGSKARGQSEAAYKWDSFMMEGLFPPKGFIQDYKQYLSDTYSPYAWYFQ